MKREEALQLWIVFTLAIAMPLLTVVAANPEWLVVRHVSPAVVVLLVMVLAPAVLVGLQVLASRAHALLWMGLAFLLVLQATKGLPALFAIGLAGLAVLHLGLARARFPAVRRACLLLAPALVVVPATFLASPAVWSLLTGSTQGQGPVRAKGGPPVVVVVFDELPLASLLDARGRIDAREYPAFDRLAASSTWYRNATTVAGLTTNAVPALLSGCRPRPNQVPSVVDHPRNLFTLLGGAYDLQVHEEVTELCPRERPAQPELDVVLQDLALLYLHRVAPADLEAGLPDVSSTWGPCRCEGGLPDPERAFRDFLTSVGAASRPTLYFAHVQLPHSPWRYLPSGRQYVVGDAPVAAYGLPPSQRWPADPTVVAEAYRRHLLQVGFADRLLGQLLDRMHATGLDRTAVLVVAADHGACFRPGLQRRRLSYDNAADVLPVPLFLRTPGGVARRDDRNVETIDVVPTVADALGVHLPWPVDGRSMLDPATGPRPSKTAWNREDVAFELGRTVPGLGDVVRWKLRLFPRGALGSASPLVGREVSRLRVGGTRAQVFVEGGEGYADVDPSRPFVPCWVRGRVDSPMALAVAVNGKIAAVGKAYDAQGGCAFSMMVPESAFRKGRNVVEGYAMDGSGGLARLRPSGRWLRQVSMW